MSVPASEPTRIDDLAAALDGDRLFRLTMQNAGVGMVLSSPPPGSHRAR